MKRDFCTGSEWLYYKIYTGVKTSEVILLEKLFPVISFLKENAIIDKWFFIRYKDTDEHLRLRLHCNSLESVGNIISFFYPIFNELLETNIVWKLETDTYQREIERYGENTIVETESLFYIDSEMIINYIAVKSFFKNDEMQLLFSFLAIDNFLDTFSLTGKEKLLLLDELQLSFKNEFKADKQLRKEFDKHYRELSNDIIVVLTNKKIDDYPEIYNMIDEKGQKSKIIISAIIEKLETNLFNFLQDHIHMMINRQYTSRQREYECLIYDHLYRYYKTIQLKLDNK